jgi:hypothetical protein
MCGLCGDLTPQEHWSDRGPGSGGARHRQERLRAVRTLLRDTGLTVAEWRGRGYQLGNGRGRTALVRDLGSLWAEAEKMLGRPVDPLAERTTP